jgi:hypothetical protein
MPPFQRRPPRCLARNCLTVRQFGPLESIDPNDAMILPHGANPDRMKFSERTGLAVSQFVSSRLDQADDLGHIVAEPTLPQYVPAKAGFFLG